MRLCWRVVGPGEEPWLGWRLETEGVAAEHHYDGRHERPGRGVSLDAQQPDVDASQRVALRETAAQ